MAVEPLAEHDVARVRADNPSPLTLDGSNSWAVGRDPCWVVDAGPALDEHLDHLSAEVERRGGLGGIALTHRHGDHADGVAGLRERLGPAPVAAATASGEQTPLDDGDAFGPLTAIPTPGHCPDHLAFVVGRVCFTGDAVLGQGSVFVAPQPGALAGYLAALTRLRAMELDVLCPGHGPPVTQAARTSSTSTSAIGATASAGWSKHSRRACAATTSCWMRCGKTPPPSSAAPRP